MTCPDEGMSPNPVPSSAERGLARGARVVRVGRRRVVSLPTSESADDADDIPAVTDSPSSGSAGGDIERGTRPETARERWLREQRPPHW